MQYKPTVNPWLQSTSNHVREDQLPSQTLLDSLPCRRCMHKLSWHKPSSANPLECYAKDCECLAFWIPASLTGLPMTRAPRRKPAPVRVGNPRYKAS